MCKIVEDIVKEEIKANEKKMAINMFKDGLPVEQIARIMSLTTVNVEEMIKGAKMPA
ncbi:MAG: hypothetical protein FWG91_02350 [Lachnospiraceae bacterium]|nr:hypothetical protein [Lachnospiraceae bacterium]